MTKSEETQKLIHDLRTPLAVIMNELSFVLKQESNLSSESKLGLELAKKQCDKIREILKEFPQE